MHSEGGRKMCLIFLSCLLALRHKIIDILFYLLIEIITHFIIIFYQHVAYEIYVRGKKSQPK